MSLHTEIQFPIMSLNLNIRTYSTRQTIRTSLLNFTYYCQMKLYSKFYPPTTFQSQNIDSPLQIKKPVLHDTKITLALHFS